MFHTNKFTRHFVNEMDGTSLVQHCIFCGALISDYRNSMIAKPDSENFRTFHGFVGEVFVSDGNPQIFQKAEPQEFMLCNSQ